MIKWNKLKENSVVIILYSILTAVLTYPVVFKIQTHIAGGWDAWWYLWLFWLTKKAILSPDSNITLTYTNYIFYPEGITRIPLFTAFNEILSIPLQSIFGLTLTYNILWLLSFILGGYGAYLLVKYLTGNKIAAFIAGIVFAFCPYHFAHALGHLGATTIEWIPFCALYLMKMTREKSLKNAVYAAIFFILVAMSDLQYMVYMSFFVCLLIIYEVFSELRLNERIKEDFSELLRRILSLKELVIKFTIFAFVSAIGILPLTYHIIKVALSPSNFLKLPPYQSIYYSADLLGFFVPSPLHPLFGSWLSDNVYKYFTGNISEYTTYIGYTVLILSLYAVITLRKRKEVMFWTLSALFFVIMSLGPILHICGKTHFTAFDTTIPLPYIIVYYLVPFVSNSRALGRFDVMVMLSFAVLVGYGLSHFIKRFEPKWKRNTVVCVLTALLIFEFLAVPFVVSFVNEPMFYKQISADTEDYALLEIPATKVYGCGIDCDYYQTIHGKQLVGGQTARVPADARDFELNTPLVRQLTFLKPFNDILNQNVTQIGHSILNYYDIGYIILHKRHYVSNKELYFVIDLLNKTLKKEPKEFREDNLIVYKVEDTVPERFMVIGEGWNALEKWNAGPGRWMSNSSTIKVISPKQDECYLSFETGSLHQERDLYIYVNDELIEKCNIDIKGWPDDTPTQIKLKVNINEGENTIRFYTPQKGTVPSKIGAWKDDRVLCLAFQNITLTSMKKNYDVDFVDYSIPDSMVVNSFYSSNITIENTGAEKWDRNGENPVRVSYHWLKDGKVVLWDGIRNKLPYDVVPGSTIKMDMNIEAPHEEGNYTLIIDLVKEGITWFETQGTVPIKKNVTVTRDQLKQIPWLKYQTESTEANELKKID